MNSFNLSKNNNSYVAIIGGANIDICATSYEKLISKTSNPGTFSISFGGVARNIAANLSKLQVKSELITIFSDDFYGKNLKNDCIKKNININHSMNIKNCPTSTYISILDCNNDMFIAVSSMDIYSKLTPSYLNSKLDIINNSKLCVIDTNISKECLEFIGKNCSVPIFLDCVSDIKSLKVKNILNFFHTIKVNKTEAETLSGLKITTNNSLLEISNFFIKKGVKQIFISLGEKGIFFSNGNINKMLSPFETKVINTNGAGDSFLSGIIYSFLQNYDIITSCKIGLACSAITISSNDTINEDLSIQNIIKTIGGSHEF